MEKRVEIGLKILILAGALSVAAVLLLSEPEAAWNDGAREKLYAALKAIAHDLAATDEKPGSRKLDPSDFIPRSTERNEAEFSARTGELLAKEHGVSVRWRKHGVYERLLFYPIAVTAKITVAPESHAKPTPQIIMVPLEEEDVKTLPNLSGCQNVSAQSTWQCHLRRIKQLFSKHEMTHAVVLRSDGSLYVVLVEDLNVGIATDTRNGAAETDRPPQ